MYVCVFVCLGVRAAISNSNPNKIVCYLFVVMVLAGWPKYSPELNPQENVWPKAENALRDKEGNGGHSFERFQQFALDSVKEYVGAKNLIGGMVNRVQECIATKGSFISK